MARKKALKEEKIKEQGGKDAITGAVLPKKLHLVDTHRIVPRSKGGTYRDKENVQVILPETHMKEHGTFRERAPWMNDLKTLMDARKQILKTKMSAENRIRSYQRNTDHLDEVTLNWLELLLGTINKQLKAKDREIEKFMKKLDNPFAKAAMAVKGVGPISVAYLLVYIKIEEAEYASSIWKYVGYDKAANARYTKGESGGGNRNLRTAMFVLGTSMIKTKSAYVEIYNNEKAKLANSNLMTRSYNGKKQLVEMAWKDTALQHRNMAAIRKMMKHFLADVWKVWRTLEGLPTPYLYVQEKMGHTGIIKPEDRGWKY